MKRPIAPAYTFNPGAATLNLSGITGFAIGNLFAVIDLQTGALVYAPIAGYGFSALSGTTLTLAAPMTGLAASDPLMIVYDDGGKPAEDGSVQAGTTALAAGLATLHGDLAALGTSSDAATLNTVVGRLQAVVTALATLHGDLTAGLGNDTTALNAITSTATWQANLLGATQAVTAAIRAGIDIAPLFVSDGTSTYVRRESVNQGTGAITVAFENMDGSAASPAVASLAPISSRAKIATPVYYDVVTAAPGYALTDTLAEVVITDTTSGAVTATWQNLTQATTLAGPPPSSNVRRSASTVTFATGQQTAANSLSVVFSSDGPFTTNFGQGADSPATSDGAAASLLALVKRSLGRWTTLLAGLPASLGQKAMAAAFPVVIASDQSAVPVSLTAQSVGVTALPALPAGTNAIGTVGVSALPALPTGSNAIGSVGVTSLPALPAGTSAIGTVGVTALPALPAGTNAIGSVGVTALPALPAGTNAVGTVGVTSLPALPAGTNAIGTVGVTALPALPAGGNVIGGVTIGKVATAGDASIAAGGTAQTLFSGATPANGWKVANPDPAEDLWVSDSATAAPNVQGCYRIPAGGIVTTEPGERPCGPVSVYGASTGHVITARSW